MSCMLRAPWTAWSAAPMSLYLLGEITIDNDMVKAHSLFATCKRDTLLAPCCTYSASNGHGERDLEADISKDG